MKIFLTGGSGMVGQNFLENVASAGYQIIAPTSKELDLMSEKSVQEFIITNSPDMIIHCAGVVGGIQANIENPVKFFVDNISMALNVINSARLANVKKLLNLGSSCMYPRNAENPLKEEAILTGELEPTNEGYALAKISAARLCDYIFKEDGDFLYKTIIPCNLYGRHDKFGINNSHMIPAVIAKIHTALEKGTQEVNIWGDGEARREFMYAGDLADFIYYAIDRFDTMPQLLNVGCGHDYTINEYYKAIAGVLGYNGNFVHDLTKPVGMRQKLIDTTKLLSFGWTHKTSLHQGITHTHQFYLDEIQHG